MCLSPEALDRHSEQQLAELGGALRAKLDVLCGLRDQPLTVVVDGQERALQRLGVVAAVVGRAGGGWAGQVLRPQHVLAAPAVREVEGTVRDAAGRPLPGALVVPRPTDPGTPGVPEIAILSDAGGRFSWPLRPVSFPFLRSTPDRRLFPHR